MYILGHNISRKLLLLLLLSKFWQLWRNSVIKIEQLTSLINLLRFVAYVGEIYSNEQRNQLWRRYTFGHPSGWWIILNPVEIYM